MTPFSLYARAMLAYSIHEHQEGFVKRIDVWITPRSFAIQDDGRGMGMHKPGYVTNLMGTLCASNGPVQLHGVGLSIVAVSSPSLKIEARRGNTMWKQSFTWGIADSDRQSELWGDETGTMIAVELPQEAADIDLADVLTQIDIWRTMYPALTIEVHPHAR